VLIYNLDETRDEIKCITTPTGAGSTISLGRKALDVTKTKVKIKITKIIIGAIF
jgi:hypothetical protein